MTAPAPRRRSRSYNPGEHWKQKAVYLPAGLAARLRETARLERKAEKDVIIDALDKRLPPDRAKSSDDSGDE